MGRMDEALRRTGTDLAKPLPAAATQSAFVAPWTVAAEAPSLAPARDGETGPLGVVRPRDPLLGVPEAALRRAFNPEWLPRLVVAPEPNVAIVEQFRGLAAMLHRARAGVEAGASLKVLMVTSADPGEGKTLTTTNLALTLSESYRQKVLLIDADLRRPSLSSVCQLQEGPGLSEGLKAPADQKLRTIQLADQLTVLPAGRPDPDPMSSLTSVRMRRILDEAVAQFDWVILDAPPIGPIADAGLLASMVDAVLLVVRAGRTKCAAAQKAVDAIGRDRILGVVLNAADDREAVGYGEYRGHYAQ